MRLPRLEGPEFRRMLEGGPEVDLTRVAFEIARDAYPDLDIEPYLDEIEALAQRVRGRCGPDAPARQVVGHINWVLFTEEGFRGNTESYYDARNSYLNEVIDRRTGIPISLSVLYKALADRVGLPMAGLNLPAHFMLRTVGGREVLYVDPYNEGVVLDRAGCEQRVAKLTGRPVRLKESHFAPCPPNQVVLRMLRNLKAVYLRDNEFTSALPVLRRLVALTGNDPQERRDLGMICAQLELPGEAIGHLQAYLATHPDAEDAPGLNALLRAARRGLAERN